jgi:hypothetical protein
MFKIMEENVRYLTKVSIGLRYVIVVTGTPLTSKAPTAEFR